jgi:hypothetical protein
MRGKSLLVYWSERCHKPVRLTARSGSAEKPIELEPAIKLMADTQPLNPYKTHIGVM